MKNLLMPTVFIAFLTACSDAPEPATVDAFLNNVLSDLNVERAQGVTTVVSLNRDDGGAYQITMTDYFRRMSDTHVPEVCVVYTTSSWEAGQDRTRPDVSKPKERCLAQ